MAKFLTSTPCLFTPSKAEELAINLNDTEEESWTYCVQHVPSGKSKIAVYDETETFVGYF